jgi:uncharacterized protein (UPF0261 family)
MALAALRAAKVAAELHRQGNLSGILGLADSSGTTVSSATLNALPSGIPKLLVGHFLNEPGRTFSEVGQTILINSAQQLFELNSVTRLILDDAAMAMAVMVKCRETSRTIPSVREPIVAITELMQSQSSVEAARKPIEAATFHLLPVRANGQGGRMLEDLLRGGYITGVIDLATTELANELLGGIFAAGPDRLTTAALLSIPQVISVGGLDQVQFGLSDTIPDRFRNRRFARITDDLIAMRTTPEEMDQLGREIALKASAARGPTAILLPRRGLSSLDDADQPFWWPEANRALFQSIHNWIAPAVEVQELDLHFNDPAFATAAAAMLIALMSKV